LSLIDLSININRQWDIKQKSIFVETSIPVVQKYKPGTTVQTTFTDCISTVSINESTNCKTSFSFAINIDPLGYRNKLHATDDPCDAILIGDSFGFCGSSKDDNTITEMLYKKHGMNTYNLSVSGNGPWEQFLLLKNEMDNISTIKNAKIFWLLFSGNDLEGNFGPLDDLSSLNSVSNRVGRFKDAYFTFRQNSPVRNYIKNIQKRVAGNTLHDNVALKEFGKGNKMAFNKKYVDELDNYLCCGCNIDHHPNHHIFKKTLEAMISYSREKNVSLNIFLLPSKGEVYEWVLREMEPWTSSLCESPLSTLIKNTCTNNKIAYFDLKPYLIQQSHDYYLNDGSFIYWQFDTHFNNRGNELIADFIFGNSK
jgi:hypothetical protein